MLTSAGSPHCESGLIPIVSLTLIVYNHIARYVFYGQEICLFASSSTRGGEQVDESIDFIAASVLECLRSVVKPRNTHLAKPTLG
ncbi:hypothetical protein Plhal304r1_c011g0044661 [Plasmopara halstedii]